MWGWIAFIVLLMMCVFGSFDPIVYVMTLLALPYVWGSVRDKTKWRLLGLVFVVLCVNAGVRLTLAAYTACGGQEQAIWSTFVTILTVIAIVITGSASYMLGKMSSSRK